MLIYNSKEIATKYMAKDNVIVEIQSLLSLEELLTKLRAGEDLSEDDAVISAFSIENGEVITQAEYLAPTSEYGYHDFIDEEEMEELEDHAEEESRPVLFKAFEAYQFNRPLEKYAFQPCEITRETLMTQLYAALGIMPTIKDIPDKNITELKRMSASGDRLYWSFTNVSHDNKLPDRADIEFYDSLNDYEKRIINESGVHPMKLLNIARGIREGDPGRLLTTTNEKYAHTLSENMVIALAKESYEPFFHLFLINGQTQTNMQEKISFSAWYLNEIKDNVTDLALFTSHLSGYFSNSTPFTNFINERNPWEITLSSIRQFINKKLSLESAGYNDIDEIMQQKKELEFYIFAGILCETYVFPQSILDSFAESPFQNLFSSDKALEFCEVLKSYYRDLFEKEFLPKFLPAEDGTPVPEFEESDIIEFAQKKYSKPLTKCLQMADEKFKELFHGHSPRVLSEYVYGQFLKRGITPRSVSKTQIEEIVTAFDQKNVSKVAKYKSLVLFALADELNFNEIKAEHLEIFAIFINPSHLHNLVEKGFLEWYKAHKDANTADLVELLGIQNEITSFDVNKTAKDLISDVNFAKGKADCRLMERDHRYQFADNEIAIRGRHIVAKEGRMKMYMLDKDDYRNFTVGYDTDCCQHYNGAGESCVYKLTSDPFAACVVIERDGKILAQGFVWTDEVNDTLVFDNVEFADDRKVGQFNSLFAAWCQAMPYKNIHVGVGYNQGMRAWGKATTYQAILPTTLSNNYCYSDYHSNARSLKYDGVMQISEKTPVRITSKPDEPTKWDALVRPETSFLLNDCHSSIEDRMKFARNFLNEQTPEIQMAAVKKNIQVIKYIMDPTNEVQQYIIRNDPKLAELINNPCDEVQEILINKDPSYIRNIQNPSEEISRKAVMANGLLLGDIENPSTIVQKLAVEQNGYAIRFISDPDEETQLLAVKSMPKVVSILRHPSEKVQKAAIDKDPSVVALLNNPSEEIQNFAVEKDPYTINNIQNPAYSAVKRAVEKNGLLIRNFQFVYPHLRKTALEHNGFAIRVLKNPTEEEYVTAVRQNNSVANIIRDAELRANVLVAVNSISASSEMAEIEYE